jgi:hypothetical protein
MKVPTLPSYYSIQVDITFIIPKLVNKFLHMPKKLNASSHRVLSHWFPTRKSSHACLGKKTGHQKEAWMGAAQPNTIVDTHFWKRQQQQYV